MTARLRLFTGLVLLAYVFSHLVNAALGLVSLEVMEAGRIWFLAAWRSAIGTSLLYGSLAVHFALALAAIHARRRLRMTAAETAQLALGLAIPLLLAGHIIGTRGAHVLAGTDDTYIYVLLVHWKLDPDYLYGQIAGLIAAWLHACIGVHLWLRLKTFYRRVRSTLQGAALLVPVLALLGYTQTGRAVRAMAEDRAWVRDTMAGVGWPGSAEISVLLDTVDRARIAVVVLVVAVFAARLVRAAIERRHGTVRIAYPENRVIAVAPGTTILEASRANGIPHASVCGGRGRCSTCRVRIASGLDDLPPPSKEEQRVLDRVGRPIHVRLACQTRPTRDIEVIPLLPPNASPRDGFPVPAQLHGEERELAILFADLRDFTRFAEKKLPYDVVFILNRYFAGMGQAVERAGGRVDKFIGDGVMALFGIESDLPTACRNSLAAARGMAAGLNELNRILADDLDEPFRMGIGIHAGPVIVGEMGYGPVVSITAIGDAVNTASRLETMTKEFGTQLVVSDDVAERAGVDLSKFPAHQVEIRGRAEPVTVRAIADAATLLPTKSRRQAD